MRFRESRDTPPPQVDLVPMLTVMMGVLAFFVVVTMTLGNEEMIDMKLPAAQPEEEQPPQPVTTQPFIVEMDANGGFRLNNTPTDKESLKAQMESHLTRNDDHVVYLLPDRELPYEQVMQFLGEMREIGGDRVSLAIEE
ncbi:biopolymer transporter ExbD [Oscillatoria sp. CS-180]|uniref:ExbD/TolR family protein n=1 Tax=Oscillatoria sp. CS-180 TaxID=3021720 RepID=UPI002331511E|nr:biopolymer transporter ExbD [Oscillatoria sp. CS-180]MDB9526198.1 biopolymer transporter ExbD [Oscillatoria sp. CS-180]